MFTDFMPHGHCFLWEPYILWPLVVSDLFIALSYFSIPLALVIVILKRKEKKLYNISLLFALFIFSCGIGHLVDIWNIWNSNYVLSTSIRIFTAITSFATAVVIWKMIPFLTIIPGPKELDKEVNNHLQTTSNLHRLIYNLHHSLKEPIHTAMLYSSLLDKGENKEVIENCLSSLLKKLTRLELLYSVYNSNKIESVDLKSLLMGKFKKLGVSNYKLEIEGLIKTDLPKVQLIFKELIQNTLDHNPKGFITVTKFETESEYIIKYSDGGSIPNKIKQRVLEVFYSTKPEKDGLGLPIVQAAVSSLEGTFEYASEVTIKLPKET